MMSIVCKYIHIDQITNKYAGIHRKKSAVVKRDRHDHGGVFVWAAVRIFA